MAKYKYEKTSNNLSFINPYNFVSTTFTNDSKNDIARLKEEKLITGVMKCRIYAKTPLAIPDAANIREGNVYPFMQAPTGEWMIPGSSIRGMLRSVFETATESCYSTMKDDTLITTRNSDATEAAYLYRESADKPWKLFESKRYMLREKNHSNNRNNSMAWEDTVCPCYSVKEDADGKYIEVKGEKKYSGDIIYFEKVKDNGEEVIYKNRKGYPCAPLAGKLSLKSQKGYCKGVLCLGEPIYNKHHTSIFYMEESVAKEVPVSEEDLKKAVNGLKETLDIYRNDSINKEYKDFSEDRNVDTHHGYAVFEKMEQKNLIPVWMKKENNGKQIYLSLAALGRIAFTRTLNDLVGKKTPCKDRSKLCPACRLFGMARKNEDSLAAIGSRVRISDAKCDNTYDNKVYEKTLMELGSPRSSYIPFYTNDKSKNYSDGMPGYDNSNINIRGRKYYWHSDHFEKLHDKLMEGKKTTERNSTVEILEKKEKGSEFAFDIYFDGITEEELYQLIWSVNFWENDPQGVYCHKIGHGKPLGLGSVKICVEAVQRRIFDHGSYHVEEIKVDYENNPYSGKKETKTIKELKKICQYVEGRNIRYPYVNLCIEGLSEKDQEKATAAYNWFTENRQSGKRGHEGQMIQHLKPITDPNQQLYVYDVVEDKDGNRPGGDRRGNSGRNSGNRNTHGKNTYGRKGR